MRVGGPTVPMKTTVHEIPPVRTGKSAIFPVAGLRTLLIPFVIMGNQGYKSNSKLMRKNMRSITTFLIVTNRILKFKSANGVTDWVEFRKHIADTLLRFWPVYFAVLLLTLLFLMRVQGSVSFASCSTRCTYKAFLLLDECGVFGGNKFLTFRALNKGWFVSVIMRSTLFGPVVLFLRPRSDLPLWVSVGITATCTAYTSRSRVIS